MCGRFTRQYTWQQLHALYRLSVPEAIPNFQPDYNVCPTDPADVVLGKDGARELARFRWGLVPYWWAKPLKELRLATFNARIETVTTKPFFREPFKKKRCLMPLSGYYEWQDTSGGKQPWYFTARDGAPLITAADRMPVLLQPDQFDHWLSGDITVEELKPAPNDYLQRWMVSKRVNSSKADKDDPTLVEPVKQAA
jgi:putative SOS response-associated peptidase YedK